MTYDDVLKDPSEAIQLKIIIEDLLYEIEYAEAESIKETEAYRRAEKAIQ